MIEALEKWDCKIVEELLPRVYKVIIMLNECFIADMYKKGISKKDIDEMKIISDNQVYMAHMAIYCSSYINGVAQIHTEILKSTVLKTWYKVFPDRFQNKTNGITQRRWLALCNKELSGLVTELLGSNDWTINLDELKKLEKFADNKLILQRFLDIKQEKKKQLADFILQKEGIKIDENSIFMCR